MRRSKSNPAKYARNYRKISQRHMTGHDGDGSVSKEQYEEAERKRLESILKQSEQTWKRGLAENGHNIEKKNPSSDGGGGGGDDEADDVVDNQKANSSKGKNDNDQQHDNQDDMLSLLSPELRAQFAGMGGDNLLILPSKKKKTNKKKELPPLTPQEIKAAKSLYKNTQRKLTQLQQRKNQKELRSGLYKQLEEHTLVGGTKSNDEEGATNNTCTDNGTSMINNQEARTLLLKSSELGKKLTKKERLKQLRRKEALGIKLTKEEMDVLYVKYDAPSAESFMEMNPSSVVGAEAEAEGGGDKKKIVKGEEEGLAGSKKKKKKKKKKRTKQDETELAAKKARLESSAAAETKSSTEMDVQEMIPTAEADVSAKMESTETNEDEDTKPKQDYSSMMFASLTTLKSKTDTRNTVLADEKAKKRQQEEEEASRLEEEERKKRKVYVPSDPPTVSTMMHHMLNDVKPEDVSKPATAAGGSLKKKKHTMVKQVNRPADIEESRYDLPVSTMEYEIIDAVRNNDCTILCGETGSGKSTQVPQFLYEAGFSTSGWWKKQNDSNGVNGTSDGKGGNDDKSSQLLIGITQPRRVAAVSTAKRVSYEMGHGTGQSIPPNSLVSYQTRYETAGLGPSTQIKFMTDGILLQEIQSDLLLRKYGSIVIDEAHERNLNTDVLLGLLSVALPLRRKAAEEGTLPPLKLVIMSATLKVEDFTENTRLFPSESKRPALVKVPGRTFPVSIHHSKVTELDDYEKVAMEKTCKIHRKLPPGGVLIFLTGKQEIVRCVNRLKSRLEPRRGGKKKGRATNDRNDKQSFEENDVHQQSDGNDALAADGGFRDMDDDEVDGDLFQRNNEEEEDDFDNIDDHEDVDNTIVDNDDDDNRPTKIRILPLYSMLSVDEQAKVFMPVPEDTRLIVVATNIAETSITIPGISYVVDSGRQKCRNYHAGTGVASYDIMWISKAAADQRAGRAGRTGPGHCYRLYSSSVYSRYLDAFALPEVLTRPLEDVVLAMKAMNVTNVTSFPFPTPPEQSQVNAAVRLLANLGCVDVSRVEEHGGDGKITPLGSAVAKLPLGVRYGKMLLVAAQANVLDYAIALVAVLSEATPFVHHTEVINKGNDDKSSESNQRKKELAGLDEVDRNQAQRREKEHKRDMKSKWMHDGGDVMAAIKAVGAYAYAGRGAGGSSEKLACRQFCEENGLHLVVMQRIAKMRLHLCKLAKTRLPHAGGVAADTGKYIPSMPPPKRIQEGLLRQSIASGLLDSIARRAPPGVLPTEFSGVPRSAYICGGNSRLKEPLFIDNSSTVHSKRPEWVCYDSIVRKTKKDGTTVATMQRVTPIDPDWLASLCHGSNLMTLGSPLATPMPRYVKEKDSIQCAVETKFGGHGWEIPPCYVGMYETIQSESKSNHRKQTSAVMEDDSFRWFARFLLEGKVLSELSGLLPMLNDEPAIITRRKPTKKVLLLVSELTDAGVDSAAALQKHWAEKDDKFLFKALKPWVDKNRVEEVKQLWIAAVTANVKGRRCNR